MIGQSMSCVGRSMEHELAGGFFLEENHRASIERFGIVMLFRPVRDRPTASQCRFQDIKSVTVNGSPSGPGATWGED